MLEVEPVVSVTTRSGLNGGAYLFATIGAIPF